MRIIVVVPHTGTRRKRRWAKNDLVVSVVEKPIGGRRMAAVIDGLLGDLFAPEGRDLQGTA
ncbi:MAG: hypothetical protein JSU68_00350 [Phycisphaerales bacterium]|nr:MAG: hypothetical protein JSU68_00350 [Phycisphaerales bacterium]